MGRYTVFLLFFFSVAVTTLFAPDNSLQRRRVVLHSSLNIRSKKDIEGEVFMYTTDSFEQYIATLKNGVSVDAVRYINGDYSAKTRLNGMYLSLDDRASSNLFARLKCMYQEQQKNKKQ